MLMHSKYVKIILPIVIVAIVAGIWLMKNAGSSPSTIPSDSQSSGSQAVSADSSDAGRSFDLEIKTSLDLDKLKSYGLPILIEFGSEDCPACQVMAPIIADLNEQLRGRAIVRYADVWANPDLANGYPLSVIPTQLFIDAKGNPYSPANPDALELLLYNSKSTGQHVLTMHEGTLTQKELMSILTEMGMK